MLASEPRDAIGEALEVSGELVVNLLPTNLSLPPQPNPSPSRASGDQARQWTSSLPARGTGRDAHGIVATTARPNKTTPAMARMR
jgi:hypothetical protein